MTAMMIRSARAGAQRLLALHGPDLAVDPHERRGTGGEQQVGAVLVPQLFEPGVDVIDDADGTMTGWHQAAS